MKKILPFFKFSTVSLVVALTLSYLFDFPLSNSWQAGVTLLFVFGPYWVYGWKQTAVYKGKHPFVCLISRFYLVLMVVGYLIAVIAFLIIGW